MNAKQEELRSSLEATQQEIIEKLRADFEDQMQKQTLAFEQEKEIQSATISSLEAKYNEILAKITTSEELLQQKKMRFRGCREDASSPTGKRRFIDGLGKFQSKTSGDGRFQ